MIPIHYEIIKWIQQSIFYNGLKTYFYSQSLYQKNNKPAKMVWQGINVYNYNRLTRLLIDLTHPEDYQKFLLFIAVEVKNKYNIDPHLFRDVLNTMDPQELKNKKFKLNSHKTYTSYWDLNSERKFTGYREGNTCISLWYNILI